MDTNKLTVEEFKEKVRRGDSVVIVDVRDTEKFRAGTLYMDGVQTIHVPYAGMLEDPTGTEEALTKIPPDAEIVTVCTTGNKAGKAAAWLQAKGCIARSLAGGITAWSEQQED